MSIKKWRDSNKEKVQSYSKKWRDENKDKIRDLKSEWRKKNKDKIRKQQKRWRDKNPEKIRSYSRKQLEKRKNNPVYRYHKYKYSAKKRGYIFNLTKDTFISLLNFTCHYCNSSENIGVDRKDNNIGYIKENCLPCCKECNYLKKSLSYEHFTSLCKKIGVNLLKL